VPDVLAYSFMQHALVAALLASIACGVIGSLVVANRIVFLSGGIAHAAYGGVGLAFYFGLPVLLCVVGFTLLAALLMAVITMQAAERSDTLVGVLWAAGMAFGIILLDLTPGYNVDLMSFLFGSILAVPLQDLWLMGALDSLILAVVLLLYRSFVALSFDEEFARSRGVPVMLLRMALLCLVAVSVVMIIRVVGLILVIALLTIPPYMAQRTSRTLAGMMAVAVLWSLAFCVAGLAVSYLADITSGASIIACAAICFFGVCSHDAVSRYRRGV